MLRISVGVFRGTYYARILKETIKICPTLVGSFHQLPYICSDLNTLDVFGFK